MNTPETAPPAPAPNSLSAWLAQNAFPLAILALVLGLMYRAGVDFLVVGKVVEIQQKPEKRLVADVIIAPVVDIDRLEDVWVIPSSPAGSSAP